MYWLTKAIMQKQSTLMQPDNFLLCTAVQETNTKLMFKFIRYFPLTLYLTNYQLLCVISNLQKS